MPPPAEQELAGLSKVASDRVTAHLPYLTVHLDALAKGLPIVKGMKAKCEEPEEQDKPAQVQRAVAQSSKVVLQVKPSKSTTRGTTQGEAEQAAESERAQQEKAVERAKRKREEDIGKAAAKGQPPKAPRKAAPSRSPKKAAEKKQKDKADLGNDGGGLVDDEEPE